MNNQQAAWTPAVRRHGAELVAWGQEIARQPWPPAPGAALAAVDMLDAARAAGLRDVPRSGAGLPGILRSCVDDLLRQLGSAPLQDGEIADARKRCTPPGETCTE